MRNNDPFKNFDRDFAIMSSFVKIFIAVVFILILSYLALIGYMAISSVGSIKENGLKAVIENIWCGPQKDCSLPSLPAAK